MIGFYKRLEGRSVFVGVGGTIRKYQRYGLLLLADSQGKFNVYDPAKDYQIIFSTDDYEKAKLWLLEDEYEPIQGRLGWVSEKKVGKYSVPSC